MTLKGFLTIGSSRPRRLFARNYIFLLLLVVLCSYGQLLGMHIWQDDNALFFKLAHVEERAGYLSAGPFGDGAYKYIATPYIPIYELFVFNTLPYFALTLFLYFLTTVFVYKVFSHILGIAAGRLVGFLYGAGYIASDGFIRLFNSVITSLSVVLITSFLFFYWKFSKSKDKKWYFAALFAFFLVTEFALGRAHYLVSIAILFELFFLAFRKFPQSLISSMLRVVPFVYIFYRYFIVSYDQRSGEVKNFIVGLMNGEFHKTYSLISSFANVLVPDWLTNKLFNFQDLIRHSFGINFEFFSWTSVLIAQILIFLLFRRHAHRAVLIPLFVLIVLVWKFSVNDLYSSTLLNLGERQLSIVLLGGILMLLTLTIFLSLKKEKAIYIFLISWVILNISAYAVYNPTVSYESINRYLAHSFLAWIAALGVIYNAAKNGFWKTPVLVLIIVLGIGNMLASLTYQRHVLKERSAPARSFYKQLKDFVPSVKKGDVFYFDVAENSQGQFADAFSVASMPEETALAWRYGVDRYDIRRLTKFDDLVKLLDKGSFTDKEKNKVPLNNIYTFFYSGNSLFNTSEETKSLLFAKQQVKNIPLEILEKDQDVIASLLAPISSVISGELQIFLTGSLNISKEIIFPYQRSSILASNSVSVSREARTLAFKYQRTVNSMMANATVQTNSDWREDKGSGLIDQDPETVWRADRVLWKKDGAILILNLKKVYKVDRFAWINVFGNNTPTEYRIEASLDGRKWKDLASISKVGRIDTREPQIIKFNPEKLQFLRMTILETLNGDSTGIAEVWPIPVEFSDLEIKDTLQFLEQPFGFVPDRQSFDETLTALEYQGPVRVFWQNDKTDSWSTNNAAAINVNFDGKPKAYHVVIPAGGTKITKIRLANESFPGNLVIHNISYRPHTLSKFSRK